jgi:hypothetical protein
VIRPECTIRLAAEFAPDRKKPHWRLGRERCDQFEDWIFRSLDMLSSSLDALDPGTYRRVREVNPDFVGMIACMPTGCTSGRTFACPGWR